MRVLLAAVAALVPVASLTAVTIAPLKFDQLVTNSAAVMVARVVDVRGEFLSGGRGIESIVTVEVLKGLKGSVGETTQFTVPGGRAGRFVNVIPGAPIFAPGDVAVIFLTSRGARLPVTTGLTQGVFRVRDGKVMPPILESSGQVARGDMRRKPVSLSTFEASVRAVLDQRGARN